MTRTCWSIVVLSLVVVMAASFGVVSAKDKDKDSKQPSGGGQPANNVQPRQGGSRPGGGSDTKQPGFNNTPRTNQQVDSNRGSSNVPRTGNVQGSPPQQFQTNKPNVNNQGGKGSAGGGNPDRGKGNPPNNPQFNPPNQFNQPKTGGSNVQPNVRGGDSNPNRSPLGTIPPQGNSTGTNKGTGQRFDSGRSGLGNITNQNNVGSNQNKTGQVIRSCPDYV